MLYAVAKCVYGCAECHAIGTEPGAAVAAAEVYAAVGAPPSYPAAAAICRSSVASRILGHRLCGPAACAPGSHVGREKDVRYPTMYKHLRANPVCCQTQRPERVFGALERNKGFEYCNARLIVCERHRLDNI